MPAMMMMYRVATPEVSRDLHPGDAIDFTIDGGKYVILDARVVKRAPEGARLDRPADQSADARGDGHRDRAPEPDAQRRPDDSGAAEPGAERAEHDEKNQGRDRDGLDRRPSAATGTPSSVGRTAPTEKAAAEAKAARTGLAAAPSVRPSSSRAWAASGSFAVSCFGDRSRQSGIEAAVHVDPGEFVQFLARVLLRARASRVRGPRPRGRPAS